MLSQERFNGFGTCPSAVAQVVAASCRTSKASNWHARATLWTDLSHTLAFKLPEWSCVALESVQPLWLRYHDVVSRCPV